MNKIKHISASRSDPDTLYLYGVIGDFGEEGDITAIKVVNELKTFSGDINVRINSGGGNVVEGVAIYNALKEYSATKGKVTVVIDSVAASIASYIMLAGDEVQLYENSSVMIHNPWNVVAGDSKQFRKAADLLDRFGDTLLDGYEAKTGIPRNELIDMLNEETWLTAEEAFARGFVDSLIVLTNGIEVPQEFVERLSASINIAAKAPARVQEAVAQFIKEQGMKKNTGVKAEEVAPAEDAELEEEIEFVEEEVEVLSEEVDAALEEVEDEDDVAEILDAVIAVGEDIEFARELIAEKLDLAEARARIIDRIAMKNKVKSRVRTTNVKAGLSSTEKAGQAIKNALEARAGISAMDGQNPFAAESLVGLAKASLQAQGVNVNGMNRSQIVSTALTSRAHGSYTRSDFPALLTATTNVIFMRSFNETHTTYEEWTRKIDLQDGRPTTLANLGPISNLQVIAEGAEYPELKQGSGSEKMQLRKEGGLVTITREMILDDSAHAFSENPRKAGQAAKRSVQAAVSNILINNPTLGDNVALFHANHNNLLTGATSALSVTSLALAQQKMWEQVDKTTKVSIDAMPAFLIVPPALASLAQTLMNSQYDPSSPATPLHNPVAGMAQVIVDRNLKDATAWYLVADGRVDDVVGIGYREGNDTPYLEEIEHPTSDKISLKVRMELDAGPLHYAGMVKSVGKA